MTSITYTATRKIHADHVQSDLVSNGDFSSGSAGWTSTGWTVVTEATHNTGNTTTLYQTSLSTESASPYVVTFTISGRTAGSVTPRLGFNDGTAVSTNGTFSQNIIPDGSSVAVFFVPTTDFDGAVDDVSVIITDTWSKDLSLSSLNESWPLKTNEQTAIDGTPETIFHRQDRAWTMTTGLISTADLTDAYWYEFLASVYAGETFTFDALGTIASPDDPVDVILVQGSIVINREGQTDYHRISFGVREI